VELLGYSPKYPADHSTWLVQKEGMKNFSLSHEDAQLLTIRLMRINAQLANLGLPGKWLLK